MVGFGRRPEAKPDRSTGAVRFYLCRAGWESYARYQGDYEEAARHYQASEALFEQLNSAPDLARAKHSAGYVLLEQGDTRGAHALFVQGLAHFRQLGLKRGIAECGAGIAGVLAAEGKPERAAQLYAAARARFAELGAGIWPADRREQERRLEQLRAVLGEEAFAAATDRGEQTPLGRLLPAS